MMPPRCSIKDVLMVKENDYVAIFHSIHRVLKAEKLLKQAGVDFLLIPVPRQLTSDCGLALRFSAPVRAQLLQVLADAGLSPAEMHRRSGGAYLDVSGELA